MNTALTTVNPGDVLAYHDDRLEIVETRQGEHGQEVRARHVAPYVTETSADWHPVAWLAAAGWRADR